MLYMYTICTKAYILSFFEGVQCTCKGIFYHVHVHVHFCFIFRHWQKLMELTGKNFDMNPETFTLENLFAMELHNFADTISDIVASANKELSIEKGLQEVVTTWQSTNFTVHK